MQYNWSSTNWVVPFGNPRIKGHLHLPAAYRSLSRPSSPPRAKASAMRPFLLSLSCLYTVKTTAYGSIYTFSSLLNLLFLCTTCQRSWDLRLEGLQFTSEITNQKSRSEWRITDSNRWPSACKADALASWANPPSKNWEERIKNDLITKIYHFQLSTFNSRSSPRQSWTADLYIISVAL